MADKLKTINVCVWIAQTFMLIAMHVKKTKRLSRFVFPSSVQNSDSVVEVNPTHWVSQFFPHWSQTPWRPDLSSGYHGIYGLRIGFPLRNHINGISTSRPHSLFHSLDLPKTILRSDPLLKSRASFAPHLGWLLDLKHTYFSGNTILWGGISFWWCLKFNSFIVQRKCLYFIVTVKIWDLQ